MRLDIRDAGCLFVQALSRGADVPRLPVKNIAKITVGGENALSPGADPWYPQACCLCGQRHAPSPFEPAAAAPDGNARQAAPPCAGVGARAAHAGKGGTGERSLCFLAVQMLQGKPWPLGMDRGGGALPGSICRAMGERLSSCLP